MAPLDRSVYKHDNHLQRSKTVVMLIADYDCRNPVRFLNSCTVSGPWERGELTPGRDYTGPRFQDSSLSYALSRGMRAMNTVKKRKVYTAEFKAKIGLEALRGDKTINEVGQIHGIHTAQVGQWKIVNRKRVQRLMRDGVGRDGSRPQHQPPPPRVNHHQHARSAR